MKKDFLYNIALCLHGVTNNPAEVGAYVALVSDVKAQVSYLQQLGYTFVNGKQYKNWLDGEWEPETPIVCLMWDDARGNIDLIIPWFIENKIACCIPIISRRQRKYQAEEGFCSWAQMRDWIKAGEGRIDAMSHTHDIHHTALRSSNNTAWNVENQPVLENPCWLDKGDYVYIQDPAKEPWYWSQHWTETAFAIPIWGVDQYTQSELITTSFVITPKVDEPMVKIIRFWSSLTQPYGSGYDVPIKITVTQKVQNPKFPNDPTKLITKNKVVYQGTIVPTQFQYHRQWGEREWVSIVLNTPFGIKKGNPVTITFETLAGANGDPLMTCFCLPTYNAAPADQAGYNDRAFYAVTSAQGLRPAGTAGYPERSWQYIDFPAGDRWPVVPIMILANGDVGAHATQEQYNEYIRDDLEKSQFALQNYLMAEWREVKAWEGFWDNWNPNYTGNFQQNQQIWDQNTGFQCVGWAFPKQVHAIMPVRPEIGGIVDCIRFDIGARIPVEKANWDDAWEDAQLRNMNIIFDIQVSDDRINWKTVGRSATWIVYNGRAADIEPTMFEANKVTYVRLYCVNRGVMINLPERNCVAIVTAVHLLFKDQVVQPRNESLCYPFGAYQNNWMHDDFPEIHGAPYHPEHIDVSNYLTDVLKDVGITTAYTIWALRNVRHNSNDIGYSQRVTEYARGRYMLTGVTPLPDTLNLLAAYSGALFPDTKHMGERWQVSLEGDLLGHGTLKRRVNTIDFFAFDAWAFSGDDSCSIVKTSSPINDGTYFPGWDGWGAGTFADEKTWLKERGALTSIIINNNLGTGSPDSVAGKHVLDNADAYIANIVHDVKAAGWDGVTCNIEGVDVTMNGGADWVYRERAVEFYKKLGRACHEAGLILHCTAPAITGNKGYDYPSWAYWCDHKEIIKYVDGMKIMSYTESAEFSEPRPAAWDAASLFHYSTSHADDEPKSFWQCVTEHLLVMIDEPYRRRIFMGGRAFGHKWYPNWRKGNIPDELLNDPWFDENDPWWKYSNNFWWLKESQNTYMSYLDIISSCCSEGVPITQDLSQDKTELTVYFPNEDSYIWAGSPLTGKRSVTTAIENNFGGVGIWKIDDGDIEEYYPKTKMFSKAEPFYSKDADWTEQFKKE